MTVVTRLDRVKSVTHPIPTSTRCSTEPVTTMRFATVVLLAAFIHW